jgi:ATP-dependent Clp protease protease subunit|tara:strand:- start:723 stop:1325 length:603 start_codon:yes stop_codon:yes gene_type:complete
MIWKTEFSPLLKDFELKHQPVIIRVNKFDEKSAQDFNSKVAAAHSTGQKVIPVIIDSYGGQVYSLLSMIGTIRASELPVATIVEGKAMSCGAVLLSCGEKGMRFADPDATIMIHDVSSGGRGKIEELKADVAEAERLDEKIFTIMARNCGKKDDYFKKKVFNRKHADWYIEPTEAKRHGLVDQLRTPQMIVKVDVDIDFE